MKKNTLLLITAALSFASASLVQAATIVSFDLNGLTGGQSSVSTSSSFGTTDALLADTTISFLVGSTGFSPNFTDGWGLGSQTGFLRTVSNANVPSTTDGPADPWYFEFNVTPSSGNQFSLDSTDSIQFYYRAYGTDQGNETLYLKSSNDSFVSTIDSNVNVSNNSVVSFDVGTGFKNISAATTFRVYFTDPDTDFGFAIRDGGALGSGTDDFIINGSVSAIPEPSAVAALLGLGALGLVLLRRRRRA